MNFPDLLIQQVVQSGIALMRTEPAIILDAAGGMPGLNPTDIVAWMQDPANAIATPLGYAQETQHLPCIAIVMSEEDEQVDQQIIGSGLATGILGGGIGPQGSVFLDPVNGPWSVGAQQTQLSLVNGTVRCLVYSINGTLASWIAGMTRYLLLQNRDLLNTYGLYEQRLSVTDLQPAPEMGPDVSFIRAVSLSFRYELRWTAQMIDPAAIVAGFAVSLSTDIPLGASASLPPTPGQ